MGGCRWTRALALLLCVGVATADDGGPGDGPRPPQGAPGAPAPDEGLERARRQVAEAEDLAGRNRLARAIPLAENALPILRERLGDHAEVATALASLGWMLNQASQFQRALAVNTEALEMRRRLGAGDTSDLAKTLNILATTLDGLGRPADALPLKLEALEVRRRLHAGDHAETATALNNVGVTLYGLGRGEEALRTLTEGLEMRRRLFPGDHPDVAQSLNNLAGTLHGLGRLSEALAHQEALLDMRRRLHSGDHPDIARSLNGLGVLLDNLGRHADALEAVEEALAMRRRLHGGDHVEVATSLANLAAVHRNLGQMEDALRRERESLEIRSRLFPGDHPQVAAGINSLASTLDDLGRHREALPLKVEALEMRRRLHRGGDHDDVATSLNNLASTLLHLGREAEAIPLQEQALAMLRRLFPRGHPSVAGALHNLSVSYSKSGRPADALALLEEALAMRRRLLPGDHPLVALTLENLAIAEDALGRHSEAEVRKTEVLEMRRRIHAGDHVDVARSLRNLAYSASRRGEAERALELDRESHEMLRRLFPGDHPEVALSANNLAVASLNRGRIPEALGAAEEALGMARRLFPGDHPTVARVLHNTAAVRLAAERPEEALALARESAAMSQRLGWKEQHMPLTDLARLLLARGQVEEAVPVLAAAAEHLEGLRLSAEGLGSEDRAGYLQGLRRWDPYAAMVWAQRRRDRPEEALAYFERGRGREMLDLLARGRSDVFGAARERARAQDDGLALQRLEDARKAVEEAEERVVTAERAEHQARQSGELAPVRAAARESAAARSALLAARRAEARLLSDVLPETRPATPDELRSTLAEGERLLCYQLDKDGCVALLLAPGSAPVQVFGLSDGKNPLPTALLDQRIREAVAGLARPGGANPRLLRGLFRFLLTPEMWQEVRGAKTLYLVAQGSLSTLPLEALVVEERDGKPVWWLDEGPPIAYEASGGALAFVRARRDAQGAQGAPPSLLALGDPRFRPAPVPWPEVGVLVTDVLPDGQAAALGLRPGDVLVRYGDSPLPDAASLRRALEAGGSAPAVLQVARGEEELRVTPSGGPLGVRLAAEPPRVAGPALLARGPQVPGVRGASDRLKGLSPLPGTRTEVEAIRAVFEAQGAKAEVLLDSAATESRLFEAAPRAGVLHLATHGIAEESEDASFSLLALTLPAIPVPGDDGALTLVDLLARWGRRLDGVSLVVLSACDTQRGRPLEHEGVFALPWGFHFAGCPTVVASLWQVPDATTPPLMADFYARRPAVGTLAALAAAKRSLRATHADPFHWASFVLLGDPR